MIFPVTIKDVDGRIKKILERKELKKKYWEEFYKESEMHGLRFKNRAQKSVEENSKNIKRRKSIDFIQIHFFF